jgi:hypothetical protein
MEGDRWRETDGGRQRWRETGMEGVVVGEKVQMKE